MEKSGRTTSGNSAYVNDKGILVLKLQGRQGVEQTQLITEETRAYIATQRRKSEKTLLIIDLSDLKVSDATSEARNEARRMLGSMRVDAIACVGSGMMMSMTAYLLRLASPTTRSQYFTNINKAERWLLKMERPHAERSQIALVASIFTSLVGIMGLVGWAIDNPYLKSFNPDLRPINPTAAVALIALGIAFFCYWLKAIRPLRIFGVVGILLGVVVLLPIDIDSIFFHDKVIAAGGHVRVADSAGICFILSGIMGLLAWRPGKKSIIGQYVTGGAIVAISLFNAFGLLYATDYMYGLSPNFVMALNLSFSFVMAGLAFIFLTVFRQMGGVLNRVSRIGWLIVAALVFVQFATYISWQQAVTRNRGESSGAFATQADDINTAMQARVQAYVDALHGFSGLFAASSHVSENEFETYYNSLNLAKNYPGLRSIAFIARVHDSQLSDYIKERQQDDSLVRGGRPNFTIQKKSSYDPHFIATYIANTPTSPSIGTDITSTPGRYQIYTNAINSGSSYASGTVDFPANATAPATKGFFITIPVKNTGSDEYVGLVNAVFNYDTLFAKLFNDKMRQNLDITVRDGSAVVFQSKNKKTDTVYAKTNSITVANRTWNIEVEAPANFGITPGQANAPITVLISGQIFATLLVLIFVLQARSRQRAMQLADIATIDLQRERQSIIQLNKKDEAILDSIGEGLIGFNAKGIVEVANDAACRQLGYRQDEIIGQKYYDVLRATTMEGKPINEHQRPIIKALAGHHAIIATLRYARKDNVMFPAHINVAPVKDSNGKVIGAIEVFQDVTKELELDKAKSEFVSLASHQLRTPLSAINWYSEMLLNGDAGKINKDQTEYLKEIYEGNKRMVELVDSLLNVSRLEVGKLKNEPKDTVLTDIADSLEKELAVSIKAHHIEYTRDVDAKLPPVFADPKLLRIILQNLLSNAVKYTPNTGKVRLTMRRATEEDIRAAKLAHGQYAFISVADTGYGIPETQRSKIFEKLFRADNVRKLDVEGTGLGLYIVQEITKIFGGRIWFDTKEGHGTTFYVVIPLKTKPSS